LRDVPLGMSRDQDEVLVGVHLALDAAPKVVLRRPDVGDVPIPLLFEGLGGGCGRRYLPLGLISCGFCLFAGRAS
jgi:hypothetical protein